jgi:uncharacterized SAM-binding protein YcdF (DUF218 family)
VFRRILLAVAVLLLAWVAACLFLFTWSPWETEAPAHADAVVVLSGASNRLPEAMRLVRRGVAGVLAVSSPSRSHAHSLARRLCRQPRYDGATMLCFDAAPYSTQGEARAVERLAREHQWTRIVVVTSHFHVTRAHVLFRRCYDGGLSMVGVGTKWWRLPAEWVSETGKILVQLSVQRSC